MGRDGKAKLIWRVIAIQAGNLIVHFRLKLDVDIKQLLSVMDEALEEMKQ